MDSTTIINNFTDILDEYGLTVDSFDSCNSKLAECFNEFEYVFTIENYSECMFFVRCIKETEYVVEIMDRYSHTRVEGQPCDTLVQAFNSCIEKYQSSMESIVKIYNVLQGR